MKDYRVALKFSLSMLFADREESGFSTRITKTLSIVADNMETHQGDC